MEATRRRVLDGARRAFAAHGYEGATVKLLEEETGLSRGAIFHHFPDKEALFLALAEEDADEVAALVDDHGLVEAMRRLRGKDAGWLGVQLEGARRGRTEPGGCAPPRVSPRCGSSPCAPSPAPPKPGSPASAMPASYDGTSPSRRSRR